MAKINIKLDKQFLSELTGSLNKSSLEGNKKLLSLFDLINNHKKDDTIDVKEITDFTNSIFSADKNNDGEVDKTELETYVKHNEDKFKELKIKAKDIIEFLNVFYLSANRKDEKNIRINNEDGSYSIIYEEIDNVIEDNHVNKSYTKQINYDKNNNITTIENIHGDKTVITNHKGQILSTQYFIDGVLAFENKANGLTYVYNGNKTIVKNAENEIVKEIEILNSGKNIIKDYEKISLEQTIITITNEETNIKTQIEKAKPLISRADVSRRYEDILSKEDLTILEKLLYEIDKEDMNGQIYKDKYDETICGDYLLNYNEQTKLIQILKEKYPKIYNIVGNEFEQFKDYTHDDIVAYNFSKLDRIITPDISKYQNQIKYLNNDNISYVLDRNFDLLYNIAKDSNNVKNKEKYKLKLLYKFKDFAESVLDKAKQQNIYYKDYENTIKESYECQDLNELAIAIDRLNARIYSSTNEIYIKEPNGKIDENFAQGYTGDCWLVAVIKSICLNNHVLDMLNQIITVNKEGNNIKSVTVNLPEKSYTIDYENLKSANEYASGDLDVRAIEIAVNRYMHENNLGDISHGGSAENAYKYLFGEKVKIYKYEFEPQQYLKKLDTLQTSKAKFIANQSHYGDGYKIKYAYDEDNNEYLMHNMHEYSFSRITSEYFYFRDPHEPNRELHIERKIFEDYFACQGFIAEF